jgi:hypothetical protein
MEKRDLCRAKNSISSANFVTAICNAIVCSLANYAGPSDIKKFETGNVVKQYCLVLTQKDHRFETSHITVKETNLMDYEEHLKGNFYVLQLLGTGSTSKAFLAISSCGVVCVIKMYVRRYDENDNRTLSDSEFKMKAQKAVEKEQQHYEEIYDMKVETKILNNFWCLILPYFSPIQKDERKEETWGKIQEVLENRFHYEKDGKMKYAMFDKSDMKWRHCGSIVNKKGECEYFVYDLADLEITEDKNKFEESVDQFIGTLEKTSGRASS